MTSNESHAKLYSPEELYSGWISNSLVLMTSSLLFYHMTKSTSIEIDPRIAGIFAVILILVSVGYEISSIVPYYQRTTSFINEPENKTKYPAQVKRERINQILYLVLGSILGTVQLGIAFVIIKGSFKDF